MFTHKKIFLDKIGFLSILDYTDDNNMPFKGFRWVKLDVFLAPIGAQEMLMSVRLSVCPCICLGQTCLEQSILIFLGQVSFFARFPIVH